MDQGVRLRGRVREKKEKRSKNTSRSFWGQVQSNATNSVVKGEVRYGDGVVDLYRSLCE